MPERLERLRGVLGEEGLDAILISAPENRRYLSGFSGSAGYLLISSSDAVLVTDFRYIEQAGRQAPGFRIERIREKPDWLPGLASELGVRRVGFESQDMTIARHSAFLKVICDAGAPEGLTLVESESLVDRLRATKYDEELELIERAVELADLAFDRVSRTVQPGMTEREVAWRLEKAMRENGAEKVSFDIIVASGPNGALPHHTAGDRPIGETEPVVIDMGAVYEGYCSDLTRTIVLGEPDETFRRVYNTVLCAQESAEEKIRPGMTGQEADALARDVISEAGYGDKFGHSLGHGVGLSVHELPTAGPNSTNVLEEGMVLTVEPGIYVPGWGGVRIEDMVVFEDGRARVISKAGKLRLPV